MEYVRLKDIGQIITGNTPPTSKPEYYGDYMQLPPEESRKPSHDYSIYRKM